VAKGWVKCNYCGADFLKDQRHINENLKIHNNFFCSAPCQYVYKNRLVELYCENPECRKRIIRASGAFSAHNFCSCSCAAKYNNTLRWGPPKPRQLLTIEQKREVWRAGIQKYWKNYQSPLTAEVVKLTIKEFVAKNGRIPVKRELNVIYHPARKYFGSWNKAIEDAGFESNPVLFAHHQLGKDGHICDSLAEKIIDDYLFDHSIEHQRCVTYPEGS